MRKSLRWRLQIWFAAVLVVIIAGFAGVMYRQARTTMLQRADLELSAALHYLDAALQPFPPHELGSAELGAPPHPPPPRRDPRGPHPPPPRPPGFHPGERPDMRIGGPPPHPPPDLLHLSREELYARLNLHHPFTQHPSGAPYEEFYFSIWRHNR